jgi:predicted transcriptional regulator
MTNKLLALEKSRLFLEEYTGKILLATMGKPKNVYELSERLGIPIAICYRKINLLEKYGLLFCTERKLLQNGKRMSLYKSNVKNANVVFQRNQISAKFEMIDGTTDDESYAIDMSIFVDMAKQPA